VAYLGSKVCADCHSATYQQFLKTNMGSSMSLASQPVAWRHIPLPATVFEKKLNRYYQSYRKGSDIFQSEYELDSEEKEVFRHTEKVEYIVGTGLKGFSFLVRRGDYIFQAPLSFYTDTQSWGLSPGYEFQDFGFSRPISSACIVCHSGRPRAVRDKEGLFQTPAFRELAVGCENCHGPGELHVRARQSSAVLSGTVDRTIVNPAKLTPWLANNICMNCHQGSDARIVQPGRTEFDFRPGTALNDTVAIFKAPLKVGTRGDPPLLDYSYSMIISKCFTGSEGRLTCLSCHDPHQKPSLNQALSAYRKRCLKCHADKSCSLELQKRVPATPPDDCAGCHMPKVTTRAIAHSPMTSHRIVRLKDQPFPESAYLQRPDNPELIHVNGDPQKPDSEIPPVTLLQAYREVLIHYRLEYKDRYFALLDRLAKSHPDNPAVLSALAQRSMMAGRTEEAIQYSSQAIARGSVSANDYLLLAEVLARSGKVPEAITVIKKAVPLAPFNSFLYESLAVRYISVGMNSDALSAINRGLELFPEDSFLRELRKKVDADAVIP
jgi:hypothetical protein